MKKICTLLALVGLMAAPAAFGQSVDVEFLLGDGTSTNNVAINTTNTLNAVIPAERVANVGVHITFELDGAGTDDINFHFAPSAYNTTNWPTVGQKIVTLAATGTTQVSYSTNWNIGAQPYFVLQKIGNTAGSGAAVTNIAVKYTVLRGQ